MQGRMTRADKLATGYFAQHQLDELDAGAGAYQHLRRMLPDAPEATVRARAGAIGFPGAMADTPAGQLSGGEKARLLMGMATLGGPHLVILDEPTNHLDIDSRAALIEAINDYTGAVILVSHDRYLLEACADRLWLVANGGVAPFDGDLDDYRRLVLSEGSARDRAAGPAAEPKTSRTDLRRAAAEKRSELAPLRRRITAAEADMERLAAEIARLDGELANGLFARDPAKAATAAKARSEAADRLAGAEEDWLSLSAAYEEASR
jgi:ATP-binding cassette subfamily F protein 3